MRSFRLSPFTVDQSASPAPAPNSKEDDEDLTPSQVVYPGSLQPSKYPASTSPAKTRSSLQPYSRDTKIRLIEDHHKSLQRDLAARRRSRASLSPNKSLLDPANSPSRTLAPAIQQVTLGNHKPADGRVESELRRLETDYMRENLALKACVLQLREEQLEDLFQRQAVVAELEDMRKKLRENGRVEEIRNREMLTAYLKLEEGRKVLEKVGEGWRSLSPRKQRQKERKSPLDAYLMPSPFLETGRRRDVFKTAGEAAIPSEQINPFYSNSHYFRHSAQPYLSFNNQLSLLPRRGR